MPKSILVVDDQPELRELAIEILTDEGYIVIGQADGKRALEHDAEVGPFDLIVTDLEMPNLNGPGLITEIRRRRPGQPCVLISGNPEKLEIEAAQLRVPSLRKPYTIDALRETVAHALRPEQQHT
jgi:two-component system cell cycle sensor histidine kinase/response regulator CckA